MIFIKRIGMVIHSLCLNQRRVPEAAKSSGVMGELKMDGKDYAQQNCERRSPSVSSGGAG